MLGTKLISLFFRVNIYNNSGVTQQPTVLVLEEIDNYRYIETLIHIPLLQLMKSKRKTVERSALYWLIDNRFPCVIK